MALKTIHVQHEDKANFILVQSEINASSEAATFHHILTAYKQPKEQPAEPPKEVIKEVEKPLGTNQQLITLDELTLQYLEVNKELLEKHHSTDLNAITNKALQTWLAKL
jgi:hypothetical protein